MIRQDYILRLIEKFGQILNQIVTHTRAQNLDEAKELIARTTEELVGLSVDSVAALSESKLVSLLIAGLPHHEARQRSFMLVTLLNEAADNAGRLGDAAGERVLKLKALNLLLAIGQFAEEDVAPQYAPKVDGLLSELGEAPLPPRTLVGLVQHYELYGMLAKAEDRLFDLIEAVDDRRPALELANGFFRRQLAKDDEELARGELPRAEVEEGLMEVEKRYLAASGGQG
ncbi:MAG: hypothetical protein ISQ14_14250 [Verrucomicrobiae bacterium]|nr:hypothetical protein [Verrucomicrobiae bacterium]